ncbi:hypothetical protein BGW80DRAFT_1266756 [Lactifluus volemus]|nr:hypothetical protein BGW80DRAFT_1266756 [Lactifluus volemus]
MTHLPWPTLSPFSKSSHTMPIRSSSILCLRSHVAQHPSLPHCPIFKNSRPSLRFASRTYKS